MKVGILKKILKKTKERDIYKNNWCIQNNIKLLSKSQINKIIVGNIVTDSDSPNLATEKFVELLKSNS